MQIKVVREQYRPGSTVGKLYLDGTYECHTLEDGIRTNKVYGETAIPAGTYEVTVSESPAFKRRLPLLLNVPNFDGVRIHPGNAPKDTLGCILVGEEWAPGQETIGASRRAFDAFFSKLDSAFQRGEKILLDVIQENAPSALATRAFRQVGTKVGAPGPRAKKPALGKKSAANAAPRKKVGLKRSAKRGAPAKRTRSTARKPKGR